MHPDLLKILSSQDQPIDNEKLVAYLTGQLSAPESQRLEEQLSASGIDQEALEGLSLEPNHSIAILLFLGGEFKKSIK